MFVKINEISICFLLKPHNKKPRNVNALLISPRVKTAEAEIYHGIKLRIFRRKATKKYKIRDSF